MHLCVVILCAISSFSTNAASSECKGGLETAGGGCIFRSYKSPQTKDAAERCCGGGDSLSGLAPVSVGLLDDFVQYLRSLKEGIYITALTMRSSQVYIGNEIVDVSDKWKGGVAPTAENIPCIGAENSTTEGFIILPVNCTDSHLFVCITAQNTCNCSANEKCVPVFDNLCSTACSPFPTTTEKPSDSTTPTPETTSNTSTTDSVTPTPETTSNISTTDSVTTRPEITSSISTTDSVTPTPETTSNISTTDSVTPTPETSSNISTTNLTTTTTDFPFEVVLGIALGVVLFLCIGGVVLVICCCLRKCAKDIQATISGTVPANEAGFP